MMIPESFEPLSFEDRIAVARVNLCSAALALVLSGFWLEASDWPLRSLPFAAAAGLVYLARQLEPLLRRFGEPTGPGRHADSLSIHYLFPF